MPGLRFDRWKKRSERVANSSRAGRSRTPGQRASRARRARCDQDRIASAVVAPPVEQKERRRQRKHNRQKPDAAMRKHLRNRRRVPRVSDRADPSEAQKFPLRRVPGQQQHADPPGRQARAGSSREAPLHRMIRSGMRPATSCRRPFRKRAQCAPISWSHLESRRLRSSLEPYFLKS